MKTYIVNSLPSVVNLGRQTETGVQEIRIDCAPWIARWPTLTYHIWVTPPRGEAAYPASTRMDGTVLVWEVNGSDTAVAGRGTMEIVGMAEGKKKLSAIVVTAIHTTTTNATTDPPEPAQPWVDTVLQARDEAEAAAERAEEIAEALAGGGGGTGSSLFLPSVSEADNGKVLTVVDGDWVAGEGGVNFEVDKTLNLENGVLSVNTADNVEQDNTLPVTSAAVYAEVGNINALLETI